MKMAELIASLDGPVYVEQMALFNSKQRMNAHKAIKKAIKLQWRGGATRSWRSWPSAPPT